jgi:cytochrome c oxidase accessory protein FixG
VSSNPPVPDAQVLSTLRDDGSRRWLYPRLALGPYLRARRILAYALIAVFTLIPYTRINGKPAILLDLPHREFTIFGFTFLPTDTLLLALALITLVLGICLVTALAGRVWCGWMCPQTVYMEFVFRPLERLFDGPPGAQHRPGRKRSVPRAVAKYALYLVVSTYLAHTFLAYFVGVEALAQWVRRSPLEHPLPFVVVLLVTGLMLFDFAWFREQMCIVACPYGRFQSVMLDRDSPIVSYDPVRGEPRGKLNARRTVEGHGFGHGRNHGDCIDCGMCMDTCPTGIDIREGLQMECIACTQCIDACDGVMTRIGKPKGLIRLTSQAAMAGHAGRRLRTRVILYPALMLVLAGLFLAVLLNKKSADVTILQGFGQPYTETAQGEIINQVRVIIENRSGRDAIYRLAIAGNGQAHFAREPEAIALLAGQTAKTPVAIVAPADAFQRGLCEIQLRVSDDKTFNQDLACRLLGPVRRAHGSGNPQQ